MIYLISDLYFPIEKINNNFKIYGGAEKVLVSQYEILKGEGFDVKILCTDDSVGDDLIHCNLLSKQKIKDEGLPRQRVRKNFKEFLDTFECSSEDFIISHTKTPAMLEALADYLSDNSHVKCLAIMHNMPFFGILSVETNKSFKRLNDLSNCKVVSVTPAAAELNDRLVPGCCSGYFITPIADDYPILDITQSRDYNIIVGRITPLKNHSIALQVAKESGVPTRFYTTSYSGLEPTEEERLCYDIVESSSNIELYLDRPHSEIMEAFSNAHIHIFASLMESAGLTMFESTLYGALSIFQYKKNILHFAPLTFYPYTAHGFDSHRMSKKKTISTYLDVMDFVDFQKQQFDRQEIQDFVKKKFTKEKYLINLFELKESLS